MLELGGDVRVPLSEIPECRAPTGLRDRKKRATRRALRDAALELVASRGYAHVTIEDIAEAAEVATRTFFNYFPSKESAVMGADPERPEELGRCLAARPKTESPLQAVAEVLVDYARLVDEDVDELGGSKKTWFQRFCILRSDPELLSAYAAHMAEVERRLTEVLAERMGTDPYRDPYPALVTATALAAARVAALYWSANGGVESLSRLTRLAVEALAQGLDGEDGLVSRGTPVARGRKGRGSGSLRPGKDRMRNEENSEER